MAKEQLAKQTFDARERMPAKKSCSFTGGLAMNDHMADVRMLSIETDAAHADDAVAALSRKHGLSGYDAAYLETAIRRRAKLVTLDKELARAAADEGVSSDR